MAKKKSAAKTKNIKYLCSGGCSAKPKRAHMSPGQNVALHAVNTNVTINFVNGSPFKSGTDPVQIARGQTRLEVVGQKPGVFEYTLACANPRCQSPVDNPRMLVP